MTSLQDVIAAWHEIARAEERYRETLRAALKDGVQQVEVSKALDRTREMLRRDAMTENERAAIRRADAERRRTSRAGRSHSPTLSAGTNAENST